MVQSSVLYNIILQSCVLYISFLIPKHCTIDIFYLQSLFSVLY